MVSVCGFCSAIILSGRYSDATFTFHNELFMPVTIRTNSSSMYIVPTQVIVIYVRSYTYLCNVFVRMVGDSDNCAI